MTRTFIYFVLLTALFLGVGYLFGGSKGALLALLLATIMNFGTYWFSSKFVLMMYDAKEMKEENFPQIYKIIRGLAMKNAMPMPKIYHINLAAPNAFATGRDENHAVVGITSGILEILTEEELKGVLAHELSHIKNKDMLISTLAASLAGALSWLTHFIVFGGGDNENRNPLLSLVLFILTPVLAMLIQLAISRSREYEADRSGAQLIGHGKDLAQALQKIHDFAKQRPLAATESQAATSHLFIINPFKPSLLMNLFSTHPPVEERIKRLQKI